jgi:hypothetical protein
LTKDATCQICGAMEESGYHAVIQCTKARALRKAMHKHWYMSGEEQLQNIGPNWLLLLMQKVNKVTGARILLLMWRAWHLRNDITHGEGKCTVTGSEGFLVSYCESLGLAGATLATGMSDKGKQKMSEGLHADALEDRKAQRGAKIDCWKRPPHGWVKINSDANFHAETGEVSAGAIVRDETGQILLIAWWLLNKCSLAEEAEAEACGERRNGCDNQPLWKQTAY